MEPKTGLLSLWVLIMFLVVPYRPTHGCIVVKRIEFTKHKMDELRCLYFNTNVADIRCWPHPIPELDLKTPVSTKDKFQKGVCGFSFILDALDLIYAHQRDIQSKSDIFYKINITKTELSHTQECLKEQCRNKTKPNFNRDDTFSRLKWGRTILDSSIVFMEQLKYVEEHRDKNLTLGSYLKHAPQSHNCPISKCYNHTSLKGKKF